MCVISLLLAISLAAACSSPGDLPAGTGPAVADSHEGQISGMAVNGTAGGAPLAGAEVVLRAGQNGAFVPVAQTTTDSLGRFQFTGLPVEPRLIYLPGVNRDGVHYPGPRVRLAPEQLAARVQLAAYDAVASPSPLICRRHEITVKPGEGFLDVAESLVVDNPSQATYVGQKIGDHPPVTLRFSLPAGVEKVTFDREFHGRNFRLHENQLATGLPWPPGRRELKFLYRVPVERRVATLARELSHPTEHLVVEVFGASGSSLVCNLPKAPVQPIGNIVFEHRGASLPVGYQVHLRLGSVPLRFETYARWLATAALPVLVIVSLFVARRQPVRVAMDHYGSEGKSNPPTVTNRPAKARTAAHQCTAFRKRGSSPPGKPTPRR